MRKVTERIETSGGEKYADICQKPAVVTHHGDRTGKRWLIRRAMLREPIAHTADRLTWIVGVNFNVLAADI